MAGWPSIILEIKKRVLNIIGFDPFYTRMFRKGDLRLRSLALRASFLRGLFINTLQERSVSYNHLWINLLANTPYKSHHCIS